MRVAHFTLDFRLRYEGCYGVDDNDIDSTAAHEFFRNFQRLFSVIGLRNEKIRRIDPQMTCIHGVQRMFRIDKSGNTAGLLCRSNGMQSQGGFTRRFGTVNFDNTTARIPANADCQVNSQRPGRNDLQIHFFSQIAKAHNRTLTEIFFNFFHGIFQCRLFRFHVEPPYNRSLIYCNKW